MPLFFCAVAVSAVTVIYLFWLSYRTALVQRRRLLRERVAHLLWVLADADESPAQNRTRKVDSPADMA